MRRLERAVVLVFVGLCACWNFDAAYVQFCDAGHCVLGSVADGGIGGGSGGGSANDGGLGGGAGGGTGGGDSGVVSKPDSGTSSDGGTVKTDAGIADSGITPDAGPAACKGWGQSCTGGDCCARSDAGVLQACSRNNLCQEYAADCKESGFDCQGNHECCGENCVGGRCAICQPQGGPCEKATDCCPEYSCAADKRCTYASTRLPDGDRCSSSGQCLNGFCNPADAGPHDGVCTMPVTCAPLNSVNIANCCPGLVGDGGSTCCEPDQSWCEYDSDCCSGSCLGRRCIRATSAYIGDRCSVDPNCAGLISFCDPTGLTCSERLCLPAGKNKYTGCCSVTFGSGCRFSDGSSCLLGNAPTADANACCTGLLSNGKCTIVNFY